MKYEIKHRNTQAVLFTAEAESLKDAVQSAITSGANLREAIELWLSVDDEATEASANDKVLELTV